MTATPVPLFLCCPLKLYTAPGIAGGSPWYNQQKNLGRWIVRPRFFALAESNRQEADCSAPWIAFVRRFSPAEIFTFFPIPFHQRVRVPGGALEVAVSGEKGEEGSAIVPDGGQEVKITRVHFPQQIQKLYAQGCGLQTRFVRDVQMTAAAQLAFVLGGCGAEIHRRGFHPRTAQSVEGL